jgi:hypothetical protein
MQVLAGKHRAHISMGICGMEGVNKISHVGVQLGVKIKSTPPAVDLDGEHRYTRILD